MLSAVATLRDDMLWDEYVDVLRRAASARGIPAFGTFELTPLCNFSCKMCYVHLTPEATRARGALIPTAAWLDMAAQAASAGLVSLTLTGGEVLTRPDFAEIYQGLSEQGLILSILTNGSLITEDTVALFADLPPRYLRITLYGASDDTYERLCGVPQGFSHTMRGLELLTRAHVPFSLAFTETALNMDDVDAVGRIADEFGATLLVSSTLVSGVRGATNQAPDLRVERRVPASWLAREASAGRTSRSSSPARDLTRPFARCRSYRNAFWLDWNGDMNPCSFMSSTSTRPFEVGFSRAWEELLARVERMRLPQACASCAARPACTACPGVLEAETGSPERVCPELCAQVLGREARGVQVHKMEGDGDDGEEDLRAADHEALFDQCG